MCEDDVIDKCGKLHQRLYTFSSRLFCLYRKGPEMSPNPLYFCKRCNKFIKRYIYWSDMPQLLIVISPRYGPQIDDGNSVDVLQQAPQDLLIGGIFVSVHHEGYH